MQVLCSSGQPELDPDCVAHLEGLGEQVTAAHPVEGQVQVILTGDDEIHQLNARYRGADRATDVLSFFYGDESAALLNEDSVLGEVYVSVDRAAAQAAEQGVPFLEELSRLMVHGLLHLAGYEHETEEDLKTMERETESMLSLGGDLPPGNQTHERDLPWRAG